jgi:hypothetical protein
MRTADVNIDMTNRDEQHIVKRCERVTCYAMAHFNPSASCLRRDGRS